MPLKVAKHQPLFSLGVTHFCCWMWNGTKVISAGGKRRVWPKHHIVILIHSAIGLVLTKPAKNIPQYNGTTSCYRYSCMAVHWTRPTEIRCVFRQLKHIQSNLTCIPLSALALAGMALLNNDPLTLKQARRKCSKMFFLYFRVSDKPVWSVPK